MGVIVRLLTPAGPGLFLRRTILAQLAQHRPFEDSLVRVWIVRPAMRVDVVWLWSCLQGPWLHSISVTLVVVCECPHNHPKISAKPQPDAYLSHLETNTQLQLGASPTAYPRPVLFGVIDAWVLECCSVLSHHKMGEALSKQGPSSFIPLASHIPPFSGSFTYSANFGDHQPEEHRTRMNP